MESWNSNSPKRQLQTEIFSKYAHPLNNQNEPVLTYDSFIKLISDSNCLHKNFTDHSFSLNVIPQNTFGCIFLAIDENNKGYLTINDWFHFNNLLELDNYHYILLYEFFKKFDIKEYNNQFANIFPKSINYNDKSLSFDQLFLSVDNIRNVLNSLHKLTIKDDFIWKNSLYLDWNNLSFIDFYKYNFNKSIDGLSLNSIITIIQSELPPIRLQNGFQNLCHKDPTTNNYVISNNQLRYLLKQFYGHRISSDFFDSFNLSNASLIKSDNNAISYNVYKDIAYLFQNCDTINQMLLTYINMNHLNGDDFGRIFFSKSDFISLLRLQYNKVNNITIFSPSQINLLFSVVANSKVHYQLRKLDYLNNNIRREHHHNDSSIEDFINKEFSHYNRTGEYNFLDDFNYYYDNEMLNLKDDSITRRNQESDNNNLPTTPYLPNKIVNKPYNNSLNVREDEFHSNVRLTIRDFMKIVNPNYLNDLVHQMELRKTLSDSIYINYYFYPIFDSIKNFALGSIAGCIGATFVYPIDLVKTRLQAQRNVQKYKNSIDCFLKILKVEGIKGLYSGLSPQLVGVAPEKAIKLTVNDRMRKNFATWNNGVLNLPGEIISGALAGTCQVMVTNPLEIVKIRLQVKSEYAAENLKKSQVTPLNIIRKLGVTGLYRGTSACLLRDMPFSAIYFPTYAHLKKVLFNFDPIEDTTKNQKSNHSVRKRLNTWELLVSGALAGIPAAFLTTPMDVIKTRLQIDPRQGETRYSGIINAARTILREESYKSFFKGSMARVLRSSPQFGVTLAAYEVFKNLLPESKPTYNNNDDIQSDTPKVIDSFTEFSKTYAKMRNNKELDIFSQTMIDPYSSNYINYYYKCCQASKVFIDMDTSFGQFDKNVYTHFHKQLQNS